MLVRSFSAASTPPVPHPTSSSRSDGSPSTSSSNAATSRRLPTNHQWSSSRRYASSIAAASIVRSAVEGGARYVLLLRPRHVEDPLARPPDAEALDRGDHRGPEAPELVRRLVLEVEERADVTEVDEEALRPRQEVVVGHDVYDLEIRVREEPVHLRLRVAELREPESLPTEPPDGVAGPQRRVHDEAAKGVVERDDHEEEAVRLQHAMDLAEERLRPVLEVLGNVGRERGVEHAVAERRGEGVGAREVHPGIVLARDGERPPAVVDAEGAVPELLEERHPATRPAPGLEDAKPAAAEVLAERRCRHLVALDRREVDVVIRPSRMILGPVLLGVGLVEPLRDLVPEILLEHAIVPARRDCGKSTARAVAA